MAKAAPTEMHTILQADGTLAPGTERPASLTHDALRGLFRWMSQQRILDALMLTLQRQGRIGFYGPANGQEAAVFGSGFPLNQGDWVLPALREGGVALMRGYPLADYIGQCFGNAADAAKGRQMPCHYGGIAQHYVTLSSPIGTQLPHAVGVAWGMKLRKDPSVCVGYMGDGATSENDFHTALLTASRARLPVVFVCQNNQWAISVPVSKQMASASIAVKAAAYDMPGVLVDGNDLFAVVAVMEDAVARARAGEGPTLIEALTWRMGAHSTSDDPSRYRDEAITEAWKAKDPIARLRAYGVAEGIWTEAEADAQDAMLGQEVRAVLARVESADAMPALDTLFDDVYATRPPHLEVQAAEAAVFGIPTPAHG